MSLETEIQTLTTAVEALTAAIKAGGVAAPAGTTTAAADAPAPEKKTRKAKEEPEATKTKEEPEVTKTKEEPKSKYTRDDMIAALNEVKEKKGVAEAKELIKSKGGVDKMADVPEAKIDAVYEAAKAALGAADEADDDM